MKHKNKRRRRPRHREFRQSDFVGDDFFEDEDYYAEERMRRSTPPDADEDDERPLRRGPDFDLQRWSDDVLRRSAQRKRLRDNDLKRGLWDSVAI